MSKKLRKCLSLVLAIMLLASLSVFGTLNASADYKTGDGLAAYAMTAYNEGWRYVWGGASYGAVDCSGLIYSYVGGGARVTEDMLYSSPESGYVSDGVPDIPGLGLWQPGHVGVYIGNGMAVDARDEISNVCYSAVSSKSWVMWFKVAGITYGGETSVANDNQNTEKTNSAASDKDNSVSNKVSDILSLGSQGKDVNALQERLKELGYFTDDTTDYFGTVTQSALIEFQISAGLTADGIFTEEVKTALFADNAPAKLLSSNVNPEETTESDNEEPDEELEPDTDSTDVIEPDVDEITLADSESDLELETETASDISDMQVEISDTDTSFSDIIYRTGDEDEEITNIQYILILLGYYDFDLTSVYDDNTAYAVAQYQLDNNLDATGFVDTETYNSLYATFGGNDSEADTDTVTDVLTVGDEGEDVESLQQSLLDWGYLDENDDYTQGVYDETTQNAVEFAQGMFGLEPDGNATEELVSALTIEEYEEEETVPQRSYAADTESDIESVQAADENVSDTDSVEITSLNVDTDTEELTVQTVSNSDSTDSTTDTANNDSSSDTDSEKKTTETASSSNSEVKTVDVPQTGVITLYPKTVATVGIIVSLLIIFFASNVHYWNVSMEKRRQRARKAVSVSAYRRSSR